MGYEAFDVSWTANDLSGEGVRDVSLYYRRNGGSYTLYGAPQTSDSLTFDTASAGGDGFYEFYTVATDINGTREAVPDEPDAATRVDTGAPVLTGAVADGGAFTSQTTLLFSWPEATEAGGTGLRGYEYQFAHDSSFVVPLRASQRTETHVGLTGASGNEYFLRVRAVDRAGNRSDWIDSDGVLVDVDEPYAEAMAPSGVTTSSLLTVSWNAKDRVTSGAASGLKTTAIHFSHDGGPFELLTQANASQTSAPFDIFADGAGHGLYGFYALAEDNAGNTQTVPVEAQTTVSATRLCRLSYSAGPHGSILGTATQNVWFRDSGSSVEAVPDENYHFTQWSDGVTTSSRVDTGGAYDISVTAYFAINQYTLTYTAGGNGSIAGLTPQTVDHGADGSAVEAIPNVGYRFVRWSDGSTVNPRTDFAVAKSIDVMAVFESSRRPATVWGVY